MADLNAINASIEKMGKIKTELTKIKEKNHQEVRSLLTEEQRIKFDSRKDKMNHFRGKESNGNDRQNMRKDRRPFEKG